MHESSQSENKQTGNDKNAKSYQRRRNWLALIEFLLECSLLLFLIESHIQTHFLDFAKMAQNQLIQLFLFFSAFTIYFFLFRIPFTFYGSYWLEKRYELSNQNFPGWIFETVKKEILSFVFSSVLFLMLFEIIWKSPEHWWIWTWLAYTFVSIVMGKIFPVFIVPLFYQYRTLPEGVLRSKIMALAVRFGMKVENIYSLNLSKTTKKANAAFCGIGKTKRIILGDTLLDKFSDSEIEVVLAHELGHFRHRDILKQLALGFLTSGVVFWLAFELIRARAPLFGQWGIDDLEQFPTLCFIFLTFNFGISPFVNAFSRSLENRADRFALQATQNKDAFISAMEKLSETNLSDPNPHWLIEFLLYDHPSIQKRIKLAHEFTKTH